MDWMEYTILTTTEGSELVSQILLDAGSAGTMIEDKNDVAANQRPEGRWDIIDEAIARRMGDDVKVTGYFEEDERLADRVAFIESELRRFRNMDLGMDLGKLTTLNRDVAEQDWTESWKAAFKPFRLGSHMLIRPSWEQVTAQPGDHVIEIDPGMAFGTGTHETTGMCVALVEKYVKSGDRVIDIGTGTGILAIAAAHMGAGRVLATDLDPVAVRVAGENVAINGFEGVIDVRCGDLLDVVDVPGDVVIANIISDVIIQLAEPVKRCIAPQGIFICSGISSQRREDVLKALEAAGFEVLEDVTEGEWCAMAARKGRA
ncbi:MAG: 50S ribosomal protein L11 methyltransferase [Clostridia bacterium]|nr:50S ribosomal protein L11 methyltransferase [Clostridia bacterium]